MNVGIFVAILDYNSKVPEQMEHPEDILSKYKPNIGSGIGIKSHPVGGLTNNIN